MEPIETDYWWKSLLDCPEDAADLTARVQVRHGGALRQEALHLAQHDLPPSRREDQLAKGAPTPGELRGVVRSGRVCRIDGLVLHETADVKTSFRRVVNEPHADREAQWDALAP